MIPTTPDSPNTPTAPNAPSWPPHTTPCPAPRKHFTRKGIGKADPPLPSSMIACEGPSCTSGGSATAVAPRPFQSPLAPDRVSQLNDSQPSISLDDELDAYLLASPARPSSSAPMFLSLDTHELVAAIASATIPSDPPALPAPFPVGNQRPAPLSLVEPTDFALTCSSVPRAISPRSAAFADSLLNFDGFDSEDDDEARSADAKTGSCESPSAVPGNSPKAQTDSESIVPAAGFSEVETRGLASEPAGVVSETQCPLANVDHISVEELVAILAQVRVEDTIKLSVPERQAGTEVQGAADDNEGVSGAGPSPQSNAA
ncbi:hypothetical protein BCR44DRAFT_1444096 [Catenaria anguillulae PL171]|uniref:Uncharacterized protein n=1 Tax=Catenaria anguillulae PL171 TaxID=765915 RepID=A0A1Y2HAB7_9FUNG|nr:hypothetical protein BCR44DRAFT_1444096 [Catenaria anguillulae PL171]